MNKCVFTWYLGIRGPKIVQQELDVDLVRLGEHDLRSNPDCEVWNDADIHCISAIFLCIDLYA